MQINIIALAGVKEKFLLPGITECIKRLSRFADVKILEIPALPDEIETDKALRLEAEKIKNKLSAKACSVALTPAGKVLSSEDVAAALPKWFERGQAQIDFIIGSSRGLDRDLIKACDYTWSFGPLTLTHGLARYIVLEQLYRAFKINTHEPYHK